MYLYTPSGYTNRLAGKEPYIKISHSFVIDQTSENSPVMSDIISSILVLGPRGAGKTSLISVNSTNRGVKISNPNQDQGIQTTRLVFNTNHGRYVVDATEGEEFNSLYDCVMVVFDTTNYESFGLAVKLVEEIKAKQSFLPIVFVGTKVESVNRIVFPNNIREVIKSLEVPYVEVSSKSMFHIEKPFLTLLEVWLDIVQLELKAETPRRTTSRDNI